MNVTAIALSGGVDSSVAALLLHERRQRNESFLVGGSHFIWPESRCCSIAAFKRARAICTRLNIPYFVIDLHREFEQHVVADFVDTYLRGKTPNPCVRCNQLIRFDRFYEGLQAQLKEKGLLARGGRLILATGHYVRVRETEQGLFFQKARDRLKDQSYMLYRIKKGLLSSLIFPLGDLLKPEVNELARARGLGFARIKESQDACFIEGDYAEFIAHHTEKPFQEGEIVDLEGRVLGSHRGTIHYTVGQRRGLGLGDGPWYVSGLEPGSNRVVVARRKDAGKQRFLVEDLNWFIEKPIHPFAAWVKVRYQSDEISCRVKPTGQGLEVVLEKEEIVSPGQSAVFYRDDLVLGGGRIR